MWRRRTVALSAAIPGLALASCSMPLGEEPKNHDLEVRVSVTVCAEANRKECVSVGMPNIRVVVEMSGSQVASETTDKDGSAHIRIKGDGPIIVRAEPSPFTAGIDERVLLSPSDRVVAVELADPTPKVIET